MSGAPRRFKLNLKSATDLYIPPDFEVDASGAVAFSGVGFVADVQRKKNGRDREIEYLTVEAIEITLGDATAAPTVDKQEKMATPLALQEGTKR
jgi:hypothetical protein